MDEYLDQLLPQLMQILKKVDKDSQKEFIKAIKKARRVYVVGAGRSGLVAKAFAMRLVHLRKRTFVVGETIIPGMRKKMDILVAVSGSGETTSVVEIAKVAKKIGGRLGVITASPKSSLACLADVLVHIPAGKTKYSEVDYDFSYDSRQLLGGASLSPLGSLFELSAMLFFEWVIFTLMKELKISENTMKKIHTPLE